MAEKTPYYTAYPGYWTMVFQDGYSELNRWLKNWSLDKYTHLDDTEWLTVEEKAWSVRGRTVTQYLGTIGSDHSEHRRAVKFEPGAPAPPTFFRPVVKKYEPPSPEPRWLEERRHLEYQRMMRAYNQRLYYSFTPQQRFVAAVLPPVDPPPPRYRRNT